MLVSNEAGEWSPGIGDPTLMGWVTVVAYFAAAWLCFRRFRLARPSGRLSWRTQAGGWLLLAIALGLLGVNKQLDLQTWLTSTARTMAIEQGWYETRRGVQIAFVFCVLLAGVLGVTVAWLMAQGPWKPLRRALVGFVLVVCYVVIRASSFHRVDLIIHYELLGAKMNWIFELGGIGLIIAGARWGSSRSHAVPSRS